MCGQAPQTTPFRMMTGVFMAGLTAFVERAEFFCAAVAFIEN